MRIVKKLLVVSMLAGISTTQAATYTISGALSSWNAPPVATISYPFGIPTFTGTLNDVTGAYTMHFNYFTEHTEVGDAGYNANVTNIGQVFSGTGNGVVSKTVTRTSCTGIRLVCDSLPTAPILGSLSFTATDGLLSGSLTTTQITAGNPSETKIYLFSGSSLPSVPIPAAAWLFGSGLIGLASARRKRAAL